MKLASHNSFTYLPVRRWWMKPFAWMARCQRVDFIKQINAGVRLFDVRVRFDSDWSYYICHGLIEYATSWDFLDRMFDVMLSHKKDEFFVRLVLEIKKPNEQQEKRFRELCEWFETSEDCNIHFFGGNNRTDWECKHPIYEFKTPMPDIDGKYASATTRFKSKSWLLRIIDDLYPYGYAKRYNKVNIKKGTDHKWLMLDFVDIQ